ncbi:hypothetical protein KUCAC02_027263, partial [Chaenocephalus aceratus]
YIPTSCLPTSPPSALVQHKDSPHSLTPLSICLDISYRHASSSFSPTVQCAVGAADGMDLRPLPFIEAHLSRLVKQPERPAAVCLSCSLALNIKIMASRVE